MKNLKYKINFKELKNITIITLFIFIVEILFKILGKTFSFDYTILRIFISSLIIGMFVSIILNFIKYNWLNRTIIILLSLVISIYGMLQLGFRNFIGNYVSVNTSNQLGKVTDYINDFFMSFDPKFYLILIPFVLLVLYFIFIDKKIHVNDYVFSIPRFSINIALLVTLSFVYYSTLVLGFMQNKYQSISNRELFNNPSVQSIAINQFGVSTFGILDIKNYILKPDLDIDIDYEPDEPVDVVGKVEREIDDTKWLEVIDTETNKSYNKLNNYFISRNITPTNDYTGLFEGKNLQLIKFLT